MSETPTWQVGGVVGFYMAVALIMVMVNKSVMNGSNLPLTFLFLQLSVSVILLHLLALLPLRGKWSFTVPRWSRTTLFALGPLCAVNITGLVFNILCLRLVDASYFQVARGLTLPLTVVLSSVMTSSIPSKYTIASCACVSYGFAYTFMPIFSFGGVGVSAAAARAGQVVGSMRTEAPVLGMVLGLLSAAMVALHAVLIKTALKNVEGRTLDLAYWQNLIGALALIPAILVAREEVTLMAMLQGTTGDLAGFVKGSAVTGVTGFLICIAGVLSIKVTSPITHMFSSAVRSVLQTALGVYLFGDVLNSSRIISIALILVGSTYYTYAKSYLEQPVLPPPGSPEMRQSEKSKA